MKLFAVALAVGLGLAPAAAAQRAVDVGPHTACTLYEVDGRAQAGPILTPTELAALVPATSSATGAAAPAVETVTTRGRAATFVVQYSGFTPEARAAFQAAVDIWADHLTSEATVRVQASFADLGACESGQPCVLGSAGPFLLAFNPTGLPPEIRAETFYPFALGDALAGFDLFPVEDDPDTPQDETRDDPNTPQDESFGADIFSRFNSSYDRFYFGTDGNTPGNQIDFLTVVLHELGHGLGFVGSGTFDDGVDDQTATPPNRIECAGGEGTGCYGSQVRSGAIYPYIFDRFVEDAAGTSLLNTTVYPQNSVALGDLLQSEDLFVDAPTVVEVNGGQRPPIWAPSEFDAGSSFSHWDEDLEREEFSDGAFAALMTPRLAPGEAYQDPGVLTCAFFGDMGWPLGDGCNLLVGAEPGPPPRPLPAADEFALVPTGPNPFRRGTSFELQVGTAQAVEATLYDTAGRRVLTLFSGDAEAGFVPLVIDGTRLAAAPYVLIVRGEDEVLTRTIVHLR